MSTNAIVEEIKLKAPNMSQNGGIAILRFIDRAQRYLFSKSSQLSINIDDATGDYPYLATTDGVFSYDVPDVVRPIANTLNDPLTIIDTPLRVANVLQVYSKNINGGYGASNFNKQYINRTNGAIVEYKITIRPLTELMPTKIIFPFNPGTTTKTYQYVSLIEPIALTANTIPLMIPEDWEYILVEGALGWIESYDVGRSDRLDKFKKEFAREFWRAFNTPNVTIDVRNPRGSRF